MSKKNKILKCRRTRIKMGTSQKKKYTNKQFFPPSGQPQAPLNPSPSSPIANNPSSFPSSLANYHPFIPLEEPSAPLSPPSSPNLPSSSHLLMPSIPIIQRTHPPPSMDRILTRNQSKESLQTLEHQKKKKIQQGA